MTNYEKIKAMTVEEMAVFTDAELCICIRDLGFKVDCPNQINCKECLKIWLESEVQNERD